MPKTTNERYKSFLERKIVDPIDAKQFDILLQKVKHKHEKEARALVIILWLTAARPNEAVRLKRDDFKTDQSFMHINLPGSKGSLPRTIQLPIRNKHVQELWQYVSHIFPSLGLDVFPNFLTYKHSGTLTNFRKSIQKKTKGEKKIYTKGYPLYCGTLWYHFKKWFNLPPYIFRHNRMTIVAERATINQLKQLKGSKTEASVWPYVNLTKKEAKKLAVELVK